MLVNGNWVGQWDPVQAKDDAGRVIRQTSQFRNWIGQMPMLSAYLGRILDLPGVGDTVDVDHIKAGYYSIKSRNPSGIVPAGPALPEPLSQAA